MEQTRSEIPTVAPVKSRATAPTNAEHRGCEAQSGLANGARFPHSPSHDASDEHGQSGNGWEQT